MLYLLQKIKVSWNDFGSINEDLIATGDSFISDSKKLKELKDQLPNLQAVEMEGQHLRKLLNRKIRMGDFKSNF